MRKFQLEFSREEFGELKGLCESYGGRIVEQHENPSETIVTVEWPDGEVLFFHLYPIGHLLPNHGAIYVGDILYGSTDNLRGKELGEAVAEKYRCSDQTCSELKKAVRKGLFGWLAYWFKPSRS